MGRRLAGGGQPFAPFCRGNPALPGVPRISQGVDELRRRRFFFEVAVTFMILYQFE